MLCQQYRYPLLQKTQGWGTHLSNMGIGKTILQAWATCQPLLNALQQNGIKVVLH